jgi:SNF2 family DNA or RNA helicase
MEEEQMKVYEAIRQQYRDYLAKKFDTEGFGKSKLYVLEGLTKLRQVCDSPLLLSSETETYTSESVKIKELMSHIKEKTSHHKMLLFSQYVKMLHLIEDELKNQGVSYEYLDGQRTQAQREASVQHFQNDESCRVFLISLKAGGAGLNLTKADYVYIIDPWWNPAVENQAIDRCYRIGQEKNIIAYRMICKDTVEEKIVKIQSRKKQLAADLITTDENVMKELSQEDILELFS